MPHYLSLQFSAIQKTILRHDRLWSIAGTSQILSKLNEIELPAIAKVERNKVKGLVIVAGGGKFTARFDSLENAKSAKAEIIKKISSTLPMLEFQVSEEPVESDTLQDAKEIPKKPVENEDQQKVKDNTSEPLYPGIINELNEQKRVFRGYGVTYNPHLKVCDECGEYPATDKIFVKAEAKADENSTSKEVPVCATCKIAKEAADIKLDALVKSLKKAKNRFLTTMISHTYKGDFLHF